MTIQIRQPVESSNHKTNWIESWVLHYKENSNKIFSILPSPAKFQTVKIDINGISDQSTGMPCAPTHFALVFSASNLKPLTRARFRV